LFKFSSVSQSAFFKKFVQNFENANFIEDIRKFVTL